MPVARHIEMLSTKVSSAFFLWGVDSVFSKATFNSFKKAPEVLFFDVAFAPCFGGSFVNLSQSSASSPSRGYAIVGLSTALVLELVSLHFSHWEWLIFAIGGSAPGECVKTKIQGDFCFWKRQFTNESKRKVRISWHPFREAFYMPHVKIALQSSLWQTY